LAHPMTRNLRTSKTGLDLIKAYEGYRATATALPNGKWAIGYGHTRSARQGAEVSKADAEKLLIYDLMEIENAIQDHVFAPLSQNQFDALASLVFNIGVERFLHSDVLRLLNEGRPLDAAEAFDDWRQTEFDGRVVVVDALARRRAAEKSLFLWLDSGVIPAPTPDVPVADPMVQRSKRIELYDVSLNLEEDESKPVYSSAAAPSAPSAPPQSQARPDETKPAEPAKPKNPELEKIEDILARIAADMAAEDDDADEGVRAPKSPAPETEQSQEDWLNETAQPDAPVGDWAPTDEAAPADRPAPSAPSEEEAWISEQDSDVEGWRDLAPAARSDTSEGGGAWLWLVILLGGAGLAGFGAYDSWLRWQGLPATRLYGPILLAVGALIMLGALLRLCGIAWRKLFPARD